MGVSFLRLAVARSRIWANTTGARRHSTSSSKWVPFLREPAASRGNPQRQQAASWIHSTPRVLDAKDGDSASKSFLHTKSPSYPKVDDHQDEHDDPSSQQQQYLCTKHMELSDQEFALGCRLLHQIALGNLHQVQDLLQEHNEDDLANFRDYDRRTPLHVAASEGHLEICQYLLEEKNAHLQRSDRWGGSPLDDAHRHGHVDVFEYLRKQGATFGSPSQATNLIAAAYEGDLAEVQVLLEFGHASKILSQGDYDQRTALHLAASQGHVDIVQALCEAGATVNAQDRWGNRPWDDASENGHTACVKLLEEYGAMSGKTDPMWFASNTAAAAAASNHTSSRDQALLDLFSKYAKLRDHEMSLDWHDVQDMLTDQGQEATDQVVQKLFDVADANHDGVISAPEFMAHSEVFLAGRPARIILVVGGPGSGKGVLCDRLVKECGVVHLSSGDLLRQEVQQGTALGQQVSDIMQQGGLVSSAIMVALMQKRMRDHPGKRILLDGFPRSQQNAEDLVTLCGKPELALHLSCDDTVLLERILKRGESGDRADDNLETAIQRIRNYHKYTQHTLDFLSEQHVPIVYLDCSQPADGVWEQLRAIGRLMRPTVQLVPTKVT